MTIKLATTFRESATLPGKYTFAATLRAHYTSAMSAHTKGTCLQPRHVRHNYNPTANHGSAGHGPAASTAHAGLLHELEPVGALPLLPPCLPRPPHDDGAVPAATALTCPLAPVPSLQPLDPSPTPLPALTWTQRAWLRHLHKPPQGGTAGPRPRQNAPHLLSLSKVHAP